MWGTGFFRSTAVLCALVAGSVLTGCGGGGGGVSTASSNAVVLAEGAYLSTYPYRQLRLKKADGSAAYAIWFPAPGATSGSKAPAMLLSDPYSGIDWTGEPVDTETFLEAGTSDFVMLPDRRGPTAGETTPIFVPYDYANVENAGGFALPYLINGIGALIIYQRFYAGGDLQDDIDDTLAGLAFLRTEPTVDVTRTGIWGSSYGGSLVLHAVAQAPSANKPAFGALSTPLVDYEQFVPYADWMTATSLDPGRVYLRLQPFSRRARAAAAKRPEGLKAYGSAALVAGNSTKFLFIHDSFDTISPLYQATDVFFGTPGRHQAFVYPHEGQPLDWKTLDIAHAPVSPGFDEASGLLFANSYLLTRLSRSSTEILVPVLPTLDEALFAHLRSQQALGYSVRDFVLPRLIELSEPRVQLVRFDDNFTVREPGRRWVSRLLRNYWGLDVGEDAVHEHLKTNGL